jgi:hypothetical protein
VCPETGEHNKKVIRKTNCQSERAFNFLILALQALGLAEPLDFTGTEKPPLRDLPSIYQKTFNGYRSGSIGCLHLHREPNTTWKASEDGEGQSVISSDSDLRRGDKFQFYRRIVRRSRLCFPDEGEGKIFSPRARDVKSRINSPDCYRETQRRDDLSHCRA